jgi:putative acetyltransferase
MSLESTPPPNSIRIRLENPTSSAEHSAIRAINHAAFGGLEEADLVDQLRGNQALISLVAECESELVGHVLFSRMWINTPSKPVSAVALAPVAVHPEHQRKGVGQRLIAHGLELMKKQGEQIVIVAGHPNYYPRFGFSSAKAEPLESPFPREAYMALELVEGALDGIHGPVIYPPAFGL